MKVLLLGNYEFDGSTSMQIWAKALLRELRQRGIDVELIVPKATLGRILPSSAGLGKWLGYVDRFLFFPRQLRAVTSKADIVHITDHGSAMFACKIENKPVLVTCHDMLAVRGALGEIPEMRASLFGHWLQLWIRRGLRAASRVACVSQSTLNDAQRLLKGATNLCKVLNGLNYPYEIIESCEAERRLANLKAIDRRFVVHVGSNHARKNRGGVMRVFAKVVEHVDLQLVLAGAPLTGRVEAIAHELGIEDRIVQLPKPPTQVIEALYNRAVALLFPSRYEGFGWPAIEAQACGCPVVASDIPPLLEILGESGALFPLEDEGGMAECIVRLAKDSSHRATVRDRGIENVKARFQTSRMIDEYLELYRALTIER
jgi:glycosyltransferase involved in cell wall biosynthesis